MASTSIADGAAAFEIRAANLGLHNDFIVGLKRDGITNLGRLGFSCGQPGTAVAEQELRALLRRCAITVGDLVGQEQQPQQTHPMVSTPADDHHFVLL